MSRGRGAALRRSLGLAALALAGAASGVQAADAVSGERKAQQQCALCHGQVGLAAAPDAPHLAGQQAFYVVAQLRAFRSGARRHEVMNVIAKALSDEDIADLAAWYASIRIEVLPPR